MKMIITLAKALKLKNKLAKEVEQLKDRALQNNQNTEGKKIHFQSDVEFRKLQDAVIKLVDVKTKIAQANAEIWPTIFHLAEAKGIVKTLQGLNCMEHDHKAYKPDGTEVITKVTAFIDETQRAATIENLESHIEDMQDKIDSYNAVTKIEIDD